MGLLLANQTASPLQALVETSYALADDLPAPSREKVAKLLIRVQQARASIMAEML